MNKMEIRVRVSICKRTAYVTFSCPMIRRARERCTAKADARAPPLLLPVLSVCVSWEDVSMFSRWMCVCVYVRVVSECVCVLNKDYEGEAVSIIVTLSISTIMPCHHPEARHTTFRNSYNSSTVWHLNYNGVAGKYH